MRTVWVRRCCAVLVLTLALVLGVPTGLPPAPGGAAFPLSGLRELFASGLAWAQDRPVTPRQARGSGDRVPAVGAEATRANGGSGQPAPDVVDYELPAEVSGVQTTGSLRGFDTATSRRIQQGASATTEVFQNADGTVTRRVHAVPVNYRGVDGLWYPIDSTLRRESGGRWRTRAGEAVVEFAAAAQSAAYGGGASAFGSAEEGQLLEADTAYSLASIQLATGHRVAYGLVGAAGVEPVVSGAVATYVDILPGTDVELVALDGAVKETIIIKSADAATQWVFPLTLQGLTARLEPDGSVGLLDASGLPVLVIPRGWMRDSRVDAAGEGATSHAVSYELIAVDGRQALLVSADPEWVRDPARVLPIRVDPTIQPNSSGSTFVQRKTSDPNSCCTNNNAGSPELKVGYHSSGPWRTRSFLKFDTVGWTNPGYRIWSANLYVNLAWSGSCPSTTAWSGVWAYDIASPWSTSAVTNWNNQPALGVAMGSGGGTPNAAVCGNNPVDYNVGQWLLIPMNSDGASVLNRWTSGGANYGLALLSDESTNDNNSWKKLSSVNTTRKPYIELNYSLNHVPLVEAQYPEHGHSAATLTPELMARASDYDAYPSPLTYKFYIKEVNGTTLTDVANSGSPSAATRWQVPAGTLAWGRTYVWAVEAFDGLAFSSNQSWKVLSTSPPQAPIAAGLSQNGGNGFAPDIGNYTTTATDAHVASPGPALAVARYYNSRDPRTGGLFGAGWSSVVDAKATVTPHTIVVTYPSGQEVAFGRNPDGVTFTPPSGRFAQLDAGAGGYTLTDKDGTKYSFTQGAEPSFKLKSITDPNGRVLSLGYNGSGSLVSMTGASGRKLTFTLVNSRVSEVVNDAAEKWTYTYTGNTLTKVCDPASTTACTVYTYGPTWAHPTTVLNARPHTYLRLAEPAATASAKSAVTDDLDTAEGLYRNVSLGQPGMVPQAASSAGFDGTSSHVEFPNKIALSSVRQSVSLWFKTTGSGVLYGLQSAPLSNGAAVDWNPALYVGTDGKLRGQLGRGQVTPITTAAAVNDGNWHHAVLSASATTQELFVDGVSKGTLNGSIDLAWATNAFIGATKWSGAWPATSGTVGYFSGSISEFAFYSRPLQATEMAGMYDAGKAAANSLTSIVRPSGGVTAQVEYKPGSSIVTKVTDANNGQWTIGEPVVAGSTLRHTSAVMGAAPADYFRLEGSAANELNGVTATASAVTFGSADGPLGAKAASFNGSSSQVVASGPSVDTSKSFSVSAWVNLSNKSWYKGAVAVEGQRTYSFSLGYNKGADKFRWVLCKTDLDAPSCSEALSANTVPLNTWTHLVGTFDKDAMTMSLFVNGKLEGTTTLDALPFQGTGPLVIGRHKWAGAPNDFWPGNLAEIATYQHTLTANQVWAQYAARDLASTTGMHAKTITVTGPAATGPQATTTSYIYDVLAGSRLIRQIDPLGGKTVYGYDQKGFLQSTVDPNGNIAVMERDSRGNVKTTTTCQDRSENKCSTVYNTYHSGAANDPCNDQVTEVRDPRTDPSTDNTYRTVYAYDTACNRISVTDPLNRVTTMSYTTTGIKGLPIAVKYPSGAQTTSVYQANGDLVQTTDAARLTTVFEYDTVGRVTKKTVKADGGDLVTAYAYDSRGRIITQTDPATVNRVTGATHTRRTSTTYNADGRVTRVKIEDLTGGDAAREVALGYNPLGQQTTQTDALNQVVTFEYDLSGRPVKTIRPDGVAAAIEYDKNGNQTATRLLGWTGDPNNPSLPTDLIAETRAYDPGGRLASVTDAMGFKTRYTYTDNNLLATVIREDGPTTHVVEANAYDLAGNLITKVTNNGATTTSYVVDAATRHTSQTVDATGVNRTTQFTYGPDDTVTTTKISGPSGQQVIDATYDLAGRQTSESISAQGSHGLVGRWKLDETAGTTAVDSAGNTPGATTNVTWTPDHAGSAVFNGTSSKVTVSGLTVDTTQSYSVSAWVRLTSKTAYHGAVSVDGSRVHAMTLGYHQGTDRWRVAVCPTDTDNATCTHALSLASPPLNTWTHLTGTYDATTNKISIYMNGVLEGSVTLGWAPFKGTGPLVIGRNLWNGQEVTFWPGSLDDVQAYQKTLNASEISAIYQGTAPANTPIIRTSWQLDKRGLATSQIDPNGNRAYLEYDSGGRLTLTTSPTTTVEEHGATPVTLPRTTTAGYNTFGEQVEAKDPRGQVTTVVRDANGQATEARLPTYTPPGSITPINPVSRTEYTQTGLVTKTIDPLNMATSYVYDQMGRLASATAPDTGKSKFTYTLNGQSASATDPMGARTEATYDFLGRPVTTTELISSPAAAHTTTYGYHASGWLASVTAPGVASATFEYNAVGERTRSVDPAGNATLYGYDFAGRPNSSTAPDLSKQTVQFDDFGRPLTQRIFAPGNGAEITNRSVTYDDNGNVLTATDFRGNTTTFSYDALGLLRQQVEPVSATESITNSFGYDASGSPTRFTDGRGNQFWTTYNSWGLPERQIEPATAAFPNIADRTFSIGYDAAGRPVNTTAPGGVANTNSYDNMGRLTSVTGAGAEAATADRTYGYDMAGRLTTASDSGGTNTLQYDDRGLLLSINGPSGNSSFAYRPDGQMSTRVDAAGTTSYGYDTAGRLASVSNPANGVDATLAYNPLSQVQTITYGGANKRTFGYDDRHRVVSDELTTTGGSPIGKIVYGWDGNSNLTGKTTTGFAGAAANTYSYDRANRLTSWSVNGGAALAYAYDRSGNRILAGAKTFTYDERNQLLASPSSGTSYEYTARGTLRRSTTGTVTLETQADAHGQVIRQYHTPTAFAEYSYDGLGRAVKAGFAYTGAGNDLAADGTAIYTRDPGGGLLGVKQGAASTLAWTDLHTDMVGQFTATGTSLAGSVTYDPFGKVTANSAMAGNLGYQSEWTDLSTGRVNMHARWYNPDTGQFDTRDSWTLSPSPASANANRYAYANQNPLTGTDPSGHVNEAGSSGGPTGGSAPADPKVGCNFGYAECFRLKRQTTPTTHQPTRGDLPCLESPGCLVTPPTKPRDAAWGKGACEREDGRGQCARKTDDGTWRITGTPSAWYGQYKWGGANGGQPGGTITLNQMIANQLCGGIDNEVNCWDASELDPVTLERMITETVCYNSRYTADGCKLENPSLETVGKIALTLLAGIGCGLISAGALVVACIIGTAVLINVSFDLANGRINSAGDLLDSVWAGTKEGVFNVLTAGVGGTAARVVGAVARAAGGTIGTILRVGGTILADGMIGASGSLAINGEITAADFILSAGFAVIGNVRGGRGSNSCHSFDPNTQVLKADGTTEPIDDIEVGDKVVATDPVTGETSAREVTRLHDNQDTDLTDITVKDLDTGNTDTIHTTSHHPFWSATATQWIDAADLTPGTTLHDNEGRHTQQVVTVKTWTGLQRMLDLTVADIHTYYVLAGQTPVLVHNTGPCNIDPISKNIADHSNARFNDPGGMDHYVRGVDPKALGNYVDGVVNGNVPNIQVRYLDRGRVAYWDPDKRAVILEEGNGGSVFTPKEGKTYFDDLE